MVKSILAYLLLSELRHNRATDQLTSGHSIEQVPKKTLNFYLIVEPFVQYGVSGQ